MTGVNKGKLQRQKKKKLLTPTQLTTFYDQFSYTHQNYGLLKNMFGKKMSHDIKVPCSSGEFLFLMTLHSLQMYFTAFPDTLVCNIIYFV